MEVAQYQLRLQAVKHRDDNLEEHQDLEELLHDDNFVVVQYLVDNLVDLVVLKT